jgi:hypothetical protein
VSADQYHQYHPDSPCAGSNLSGRCQWDSGFEARVVPVMIPVGVYLKQSDLRVAYLVARGWDHGIGGIGYLLSEMAKAVLYQLWVHYYYEPEDDVHSVYVG